MGLLITKIWSLFGNEGKVLTSLIISIVPSYCYSNLGPLVPYGEAYLETHTLFIPKS